MRWRFWRRPDAFDRSTFEGCTFERDETVGIPIGLAIEALKQANPVETPDREPALFVCPTCMTPSWNKYDAEFGYCGRCHWWTGTPTLRHPEGL